MRMNIYFQHYRKSLFFRFMALIFALVSALLLLFSFFYYRIISDNYIKQGKSINESLIQQIADNIEGSIGFIEQRVISVGENKFAVNAAVQPGMAYSERNASLLLYLKETNDSNKLISTICIYEKTTDTVYISNETIVTLNHALQQNLIRACISANPQSILSSVPYRFETYLFYYDENIYLVHASIQVHDCYDLFVIAELNKEALFNSANVICKQTSNRLDILNEDNAVVLSVKPDSEAAALDPDNTITIEMANPSWTYRLYPYNAALPSAAHYLASMLPFFIIILIISILMVPLISWRVYSPIRELVYNISVEEEASEVPPHNCVYRNEIEYLRSTYDAAIHNRNEISLLIKEVRPELEERLLLSLINGADYTESELLEKLNNMFSTYSINDKYQVILAYPRPTPGRDSDIDTQIILHQLRDLLQQMHLANRTVPLFLTGIKGYGIVILHYPRTSPNELIKNCGSQVIEEMKHFVMQHHISVLYAKGKIIDGVRDIRLSFENAEESIRYQIYFENEQDELDGKTETETNPEQAEFNEQIELLVDHLKRYELVLADKMVDCMLYRIEHSEIDPSIKKYQYIRILDVLAERALTPGNDDFAHKRKYIGEVYNALRNTSLQENLDRNVYDAAQELLKLTKEASVRKKSRLVIRAKECIENNYNNIDLSVNAIADEIGISASYLSMIFVEYAGENLVSYLSAYRVNMAKDFLANTNIIIRDVGYKTGFNTIQNFNRVFKRYVGITPSEYRCKYQKQ